MNASTRTAPGGTGRDDGWADDRTSEADGFGFNAGEMIDATEAGGVEKYADDDGADDEDEDGDGGEIA